MKLFNGKVPDYVKAWQSIERRAANDSLPMLRSVMEAMAEKNKKIQRFCNDTCQKLVTYVATFNCSACVRRGQFAYCG